jgi:hypothetical protein
MIEPSAPTSWDSSATEDARHRAQRRRAFADAIGHRHDSQTQAQESLADRTTTEPTDTTTTAPHKVSYGPQGFQYMS